MIVARNDASGQESALNWVVLTENSIQAETGVGRAGIGRPRAAGHGRSDGLEGLAAQAFPRKATSAQTATASKYETGILLVRTQAARVYR